MLRKKLKDKDTELVKCRAEIERREHELASKERVIAERDGVVEELRQQVAALTAELQASVDTSQSVMTVTDSEVCNCKLSTNTGFLKFCCFTS